MHSKEPIGFTFVVDHPYSGWIAFVIALLVFAGLIAWHYKRQVDLVKEAMATVRQADFEERASLLQTSVHVPNIPRFRPSDDLVFTESVTSEDTWNGEFDTTFLQRSHRIPFVARMPTRYVPSLTCFRWMLANSNKV
jgi:hypothetical protein